MRLKEFKKSYKIKTIVQGAPIPIEIGKTEIAKFMLQKKKSWFDFVV